MQKTKCFYLHWNENDIFRESVAAANSRAFVCKDGVMRVFADFTNHAGIPARNMYEADRAARWLNKHRRNLRYLIS